MLRNSQDSHRSLPVNFKIIISCSKPSLNISAYYHNISTNQRNYNKIFTIIAFPDGRTIFKGFNLIHSNNFRSGNRPSKMSFRLFTSYNTLPISLD